MVRRKMPSQKPGRSKQDYSTPADFMAVVRKRFGIKAFAIDLAAHSKNTKAKKFFTEKDDSLLQKWKKHVKPGQWAWLNPPFGQIPRFVQKSAGACTHGVRILFLVPASVGANWFRNFVLGVASEVLFLNGRLCFDGVAGYPKDCMLVVFDLSSYKRATRFRVWDWRRNVMIKPDGMHR